MRIILEQYFDVVIEQHCTSRYRFQKKRRVYYLDELQRVIKNFNPIVNVNIPTFVSVTRGLQCEDACCRNLVGSIDILDDSKKEIKFFVVRENVPTVGELKKQMLLKSSRLQCKYDANMLVYYDNYHPLQPIRLLKPRKHVVVKQDSLQQLYPTPTNALPKKIVKFFEEPIDLFLAHPGISVKGRERG